VAIDIQGLIGSEIGLRLAGFLGRALPPRLGYSFADFIADRIASRRNSRIVRAVRANQWVVRGETLEGKALDRAVREAFRHTARSIFDLHRGLQNPEAAQASIELGPDAGFLLRRPEFDDRGLVVASLHLGNFDLVLHSLSMRGMKAMVLTIPDPRGGRRVEFESRKKAGAKLLPASIAGFRRALRHLRRGGIVATGIDRPIPRPEIRPVFFGRPASLPLHHIFLALKAMVPVMLIATIRQPDGMHRFLSSGPMEMDPHPDRGREMQRNAEKVLRIAEDFIRQAPAQWSESLPVWPEILESVPG
jgi:KDO2-lipid IV(A) lauroyltransferase